MTTEGAVLRITPSEYDAMQDLLEGVEHTYNARIKRLVFNQKHNGLIIRINCRRAK